MGGIADPPIVSVVYRGWLTRADDKARALWLSSEGDIAARVRRDVERFGHTARIRLFSAASEISIAAARAIPWSGEGFVQIDGRLRTSGTSLIDLLVARVGQYLHMEIEFRLDV